MEPPHAPASTNRLIHATSPYLLQHAHNPVDWYEWGPEALKKAREEDKPIFLSIGYAACHWCHVMEHECFEQQSVADLLNEHFVSIKVDREERPDLDEIYMQATLAMTGHGGWPMSCFLTPEAAPFLCGTYFPRERFEALLQRVAQAWRTDRTDLAEQSARVREYLLEWAAAPSGGEGVIPLSAADETAKLLARNFDPRLGGPRSDGNKFPPSMAMDLMLRVHHRTGEKQLLEAVKATLTAMANGGIYDQLGGGICRYSTDPEWLVPHFEKMLYDQALVAAIFVDGFLVTADPLYARAARGIFDYVLADLQSPEGGFYSTRDADSEGLEGKYYIWTVEQVKEVLGEADAKLFGAYYDVTESGNWFERFGHAPPGPKNILRVQRSAETVAKLHDLPGDELESRLAQMRLRMLETRSKRVPPGLDDKILTDWNGLMIAGLAKGSRALREPRYAQGAVRAADFVLQRLRQNGKLLRTYRAGQARLTAYLTDYAFFTEGLLNLYEATFDPRWLREAVALTDDLIARFHDPAGGGFYLIPADGEQLLARTKDASDGALPSGNSVAALNLLRLSLLTGNADYREKAESIFRAFAPVVRKSPGQLERLLCAVDFYHSRPKEIVIVGPQDGAETNAMLAEIFGTHRPNRVVAFATADAAPSAARLIPLFQGKSSPPEKTTAYVCENRVCKKPTTSVEELRSLLKGR